MPNFIKSNPFQNHPGSVPVHCRHVFSLTQRKHTPSLPGWVGGRGGLCRVIEKTSTYQIGRRTIEKGRGHGCAAGRPGLPPPPPPPPGSTTPFQTKVRQTYNSCRQTIHAHLPSQLTLVLLNPDIPYLCKQSRARSVGFQLIWIGTVCHSVCQIIYQQSESRNLTG